MKADLSDLDVVSWLWLALCVAALACR